MFEAINKTSQTVTAAGAIALGTASVSDSIGRITLASASSIKIASAGKYKVSALFSVSNTTSSAVDDTIALYSGSNELGLPITVTVPATGNSEIVIEKIINVLPASADTSATIQFISSTGATVTGCQVIINKMI